MILTSRKDFHIPASATLVADAFIIINTSFFFPILFFFDIVKQ